MKGTCSTIHIDANLHSSRQWIGDLGASNHICNCKHVFSSMKPIREASITLPDKSKIPIYFNENVPLFPHLVLTNVLYVPQFKFNLLSVSALTNSSPMSILLLTDYCIFQDHLSMKMIDKGDKMADLYVLNAKKIATNKFSIATMSSNSSSSNVVPSVTTTIYAQI